MPAQTITIIMLLLLLFLLLLWLLFQLRLLLWLHLRLTRWLWVVLLLLLLLRRKVDSLGLSIPLAESCLLPEKVQQFFFPCTSAAEGQKQPVDDSRLDGGLYLLQR